MKVKEGHKMVVDEYFTNGLRRNDAYMSVYKNVKRTNAATSFYLMLRRPEVLEYYKEVQKGMTDALGLNKKGVILSLHKDLEALDELLALACNDGCLTSDQQEKFERLTCMYNGVTKVSIMNLICKITGAFEPEKIQIESVNYTVDFGK